jgi:MoxR-like ATPase
MLPSDVIGISIFNQIEQRFEFKPGPIFANIVLADEINRTTPKTQSALLEAMNEAQVTVDNRTYPLPQPFMVLATQNPIEHHGTYPLPESQLDRFLLRIRMGYPFAPARKRDFAAQQRRHRRRASRRRDGNSNGSS